MPATLIRDYAFEHHPFNERSDFGYVICRDLQEQGERYVHCTKLGNASVRHANLNSIQMTSSRAPCVMNVRRNDFASFDQVPA